MRVEGENGLINELYAQDANFLTLGNNQFIK